MTTKSYIWRCGDSRLELGARTLIMGILNVTPDSFSDGGQYLGFENAIEHAAQMATDGADIIDVGGESTRPGADPISDEEEIQRVIPVVRALRERLSIPVSIDTYKSVVALQAIDAGASIINDISGLTFDSAMTKVVAERGAGIIIMHIKGTPRNMQKNPHYDDVMGEISLFLKRQIELAETAGVAREQMVIDPGIGFGKRLEDNFTILRELNRLQELALPILVGPSRKSFIGQTLNLPPDERLEGTAAAVTASILGGAHIVRLHDVKQMKRVTTIADAIKNNKSE